MYRNCLKRFFDCLLSFVAILVLSPLFLIISILVKLTSKGPVFFKQLRIGKNGRTFNIVKFRTMIVGAESMKEGVDIVANDRRVTRFGKFLRKTSIDELPQLFNIFVGRMAIVGPRAPAYYFFPKYENLDEKCKKRFSVRPGITGYSQTVGRNSFSWYEKIENDNIYVDKLRKLGILIDIAIVFKTVLRVFSMSNIDETEQVKLKNEKFINEYGGKNDGK